MNRIARPPRISRIPVVLVNLFLFSSVFAQPVPPPPDLISWWPGDGNANDISDSNHGITRGGVTFAPGLVGEAFSFDGDGDYVVVPDSTNLNPGVANFTLDFWMKTATPAVTFTDVFSKRPGCTDGSIFDMGILAGGKFRAVIRNFAPNVNDLRSRLAVNDGIWHHVAFVRQGTEARLYIDGTPEDSGTTANVVNVANIESLFIGTSSCNLARGLRQPYTGLLDEIEFFNRALTGAEVEAIFDAGSDGKIKPDVPVVLPPKVVIPYMSTYRFEIVSTGGLPGFEQPGFSDVGFSVGTAAFGTPSGGCVLANPVDVKTTWSPLFTDILLRKEFDVPPGCCDLQVIAAIDDKLQVFMNGQDISGGIVGTTGCAFRDGLVFQVPDDIVDPGANLLAVRGKDQGGVVDFLDIEILGGTCRCEPRTQGFWRRQCQGPHPSGEHERLPDYVGFVNNTATFAGVTDVDELCERLGPFPPWAKCEQAESQFVALLLNLASGRLHRNCCVDSEDTTATTIGAVADEIDALLSSATRTDEDCARAQALAASLNEGSALCEQTD